MKVIIAGSRSITNYNAVSAAMEKAQELGLVPTEIVSGRASGVDRLGERWANKHGIPLTKFPADWNAYGKSAGVIRNSQMGRYADALVAVWDGVSRGTDHMITFMKSLGKPVHVYDLREV